MMRIGSFSVEGSDQVFSGVPFTAEPNLIEWPNLPSNVKSPS